MKKVVIVDYNGGNLASAAQAARRAAREAMLDLEVIISGHVDDLLNADRIILPGQGAFAHCAQNLSSDIRQALQSATESGIPFLGICVGMQLMAQSGLEHGCTPGLGWIRGQIARMQYTKDQGLRLPHMGWNTLDFQKDAHPILEGISPGAHVYFVHSYALTDGNAHELIATTHYGRPLPAIVASGSRVGTQFHVEKSQTIGLRMMANFLRWSPIV